MVVKPKSVSEELAELFKDRKAVEVLIKGSTTELRERLLSGCSPEERAEIMKTLDKNEREEGPRLSPEELARIFGA